MGKIYGINEAHRETNPLRKEGEKEEKSKKQRMEEITIVPFCCTANYCRAMIKF